MTKYLIMPEGTRWSGYEHIGGDEKTIYSLNCTLYNPSTRIGILNTETGKLRIFSRTLEPNGNIKEVVEHFQGGGTV